MTTGAERNRRWKLRHPRRVYETKLANYASTAKNNPNRCQKYTCVEDDLILTYHLTDRRLHHIIGRSVQAIQVRRARLKGSNC